MADNERSRTVRSSRRQEKQGAKRLGLQQNPGSGAGDRKNDGRTKRDDPGLPKSVEFKQTGSISYRLRLEELITASKHALVDGRTMLFGLEFTNAKGGPPWQYILMEESDYRELEAKAIAVPAEQEKLKKEVEELKNKVVMYEQASRSEPPSTED